MSLRDSSFSMLQTILCQLLWTGLTLLPQDLKDFARQSGNDVVYSEVNRDRGTDGTGKG